MKFRLYLLVVTAVVPLLTKAQIMQQLNAAEIKQGLEALNVTGSVLYVAAHPDDENTRLLGYLAKEKKVRTGYLSLTRGDGGQNLIGNEQAELLGLIRTQELLAARRTDGAEQFFTRANDFGFSKNPEESFKIWDKQKILADVVWVIRKFQPDVIITRFPEDGRAGHGHHSGSAILAREAFTAAADPKQFPEQLAFVKPWQARRIVWNTFNFGGNNTTSDDQLKIDVGSYNALLGKSYGEIAAESRSNHRSQGFGAARQRGSSIEFFTPVAGEKASRDIFEGVDFSLNRIPGSAAAQQLLNEINKEYNAADPSAAIAKLLKLRELVKGKPFKQELLDDLILACAGIWFESAAANPSYALNQPVNVKVQGIARVKDGFPLSISLEESITGAKFDLAPNKFMSQDKSLSTNQAKLTQPYWLEKPHPLGTFVVDSLSKIGLAENGPGLSALFKIKIGDQVILKKRPVVYKYTDQVRGEIYQPLVIAPPVTATLAEKAFIFTGNTPKKVTVQLKSFKENASGSVVPQLPSGWKVSPEKADFTLSRKGEEQLLELTVTPGGNTAGGNLSLNVNVDGVSYNKGLRVIDYEHIPVQTLFPLAEARVDKVELKLAGKRIGYITGAGDLVPEALKQVGYDVVSLNENQVINTDLSAFDAIVTGVRLYNVNEQIRSMQPKLMKYVENGGTLLVQYNVNSPLKIENLGPYPFRLSRDRVTEEDAKVDILKPENPVFNYPNKLTAKDFEGWIQERGLYFVTDADPKYTAVLSMNDAGESAKTGSLIIADYGKGRFVYTGLSFFRQLPAGVPGAYRLFVNLLSGKK
ncbi:LmbE family N-acetylglucosaminyl deacetylase [Pedobacter africanus]|uniref:LmbE family N-acetylglucosaminyl deacetylase n=1 Tax=Pedobacter africanus TaxID=151894 RepID=A0ACC6KVH1_9SPHI|nr:PIG-L family deacetylase [Pedobacter africanus]MDR6783150.1 LmbE family N-acetylglucosaminyl deacetylase [Pedobacter africanus]